MNIKIFLKQLTNDNWEHPNFAKIKIVVGASCSLMEMLRAREPSLQKINLHIWDAP